MHYGIKNLFANTILPFIQMSSFQKVSKDSFNGVVNKAKIPDGSGGRSVSTYKVVDSTIDVPVNGFAYVLCSASATTPVKTWVWKPEDSARNLSLLNKDIHTDAANAYTVENPFVYTELNWKDPVCRPKILHHARNKLVSDGLGGDASVFSNVDETGDMVDPSSLMTPLHQNVGTYGTSELIGKCNKFTTGLNVSPGLVDECPKRWRCVASSTKLQSLSVPEYTAGYWKSCDYFPNVSTYTQGLYIPAEEVSWTASVGEQDFSVGNVHNLSSLGGVVPSANNQPKMQIKTHLDMKLVDEWLQNEPHMAEKPSYNEGSNESLKGIQFNLQRKNADKPWLTQGLLHSDTMNRVITDRSIQSKYFTNTDDQAITTGIDDSHRFVNIPGTVVPANDKITYERNIFPTLAVNKEEYGHPMTTMRMYGSADLDQSSASASVNSTTPYCMSLQGLEANAALKVVLESQMDPNLSCKVIMLRNTGMNPCKFRISTSGVFEITPDLDSSEYPNSRPVLKEDAFEMKQSLKLGTSASRRTSR